MILVVLVALVAPLVLVVSVVLVVLVVGYSVAPVVQTMDSAIHRINRYPLDK